MAVAQAWGKERDSTGMETKVKTQYRILFVAEIHTSLSKLVRDYVFPPLDSEDADGHPSSITVTLLQPCRECFAQG